MRAAFTFLTCLALTAAVTGTASAKTVWLCKPGLAENPCARSLTSTVVGADGSQTTERAAPAAPAEDRLFLCLPHGQRPGQDQRDEDRRAGAEVCGRAAGRSVRPGVPCVRSGLPPADGERRSEARFSAAAARRAYGDVRAAWRDYLRNHNRGRGVVLVGHSQGAYLLRQLIRDEIDRRADVRRRLVSALLLGGNVLVKKGRDSGGDFRNIRACRAARPDRMRGRLLGLLRRSARRGAFRPGHRPFRTSWPIPATEEVLCTNPAALGGGSGGLDPYFSTRPSPGPRRRAQQAACVGSDALGLRVRGATGAACRRQ